MKGKGLPFFQGKGEFGKLHPTPAKYCSHPKKVAGTGAILLSIRAPVGPTNVSLSGCCIGRGLAAISPLGGIPNRFVLWYLRHHEPVLAKSGTGSTITAITKSQVASIPIELPPLDEQHRIVKKIESLFEEIDNGIESLQTAKKSIELYRQSLLKSAFEGRLTARWREKNRDKLKIPDALMKRVCAAHANRVHDSAYSRVQTDSKGKTHGLNQRQVGAGRVQDTSSLAIDIDIESWTVCKIGDVLEPVEKTGKGEKDRHIWYVDISSIDNETNTIAAPKRMRLAEAPTRARQKIRLGDVLFSTVRPYLRNIAFVEGVLDGEIASTGFAVLRGVSGIDSRYVFYKSISNKFVSALTGEQYGVSYPAVKREQVWEQPFELTSIEEQSEIVRILDTNFQVLKELSAEINSTLASTEVLRQSILKMAFSGQLVSQDSKDEPASVLLERIGTNRARTQTIKKGVKSDASR